VDCLRDFERAVVELALPCVLKHRRGAGGCGVTFLHEPQDVEHQRAERTNCPA